MTDALQDLGRLRQFVVQMTDLVNRAGGDEPTMLDTGAGYLKELVARDDWLPAFCATPHPEHYQQYLLHCDPQERFSVVSFVWGPGQETPVHDHTVWGLVGMLRGAELEQRYAFEDNALVPGQRARLNPGDIGMVSPRIGDMHKVSNACDDRVSISIHVYGANIGRVHRHVFSQGTGEKKNFVSGYANDVLPNLWSGDS
ncbi:MAG: hypothetical protein WED00_18180 [Aquisalimonadaceae bacterium]